MSGVCFHGAGVRSGQVQRREAAVGLAVQLGSVLQEETRHRDAAPAAGAVEGRPPVDGARVHLRPGGE